MMPCRPDTCAFGTASSTLSVPAMYRIVTTTPAATIARGTVRRASSISSPIVDPLSTPTKANAIVDQKITSFRPVPGTNARGGIGVADPNRLHDTAPSPISTRPEVQPEIAPRLFSHFPTLRPTTFMATAIVKPIIENTMKYVPLPDSACHRAPPMNSAFAAAKYSRPGRYGRFVPQYSQPVMNPANGPNARLLQT